MNLLLTGATGFLGNYLYDYLRIKYTVHTLGRNVSNNIVCDLSETVPKITREYQYVVHCAGKAHSIPKTKEEKQQFFDVNYIGTKNLCKSLEKKLPKTFVFISTIAVYGKRNGTQIREDAPLEGKSPYAISKIKAEKYLQDWALSNKVDLVILRLPLIAGHYPKGNLLSMISAIKKGYYFNIKNNKSLKSIVLAQDVAKLISLIENKNGVYNLSGERDYSFNELAVIISKQINNKKIIDIPLFFVKIIAFFGDHFSFIPINSLKLKIITSSLTISDLKARQELGWNPTDLEKNFKIF